MLDNLALGPYGVPDPLDSRGLPSRFRLGTLQVEDEASIVEIIGRTLLRFPEEGQVLASTHRRLPRFYHSYQEQGADYIVLKDSLTGGVVGGAGIRSFAGLDPREALGEIRELVIDPQFRGLGLGRALLAAATQRARVIGYKRLYLEATSDMRHAQTLFQRSGFRPLAAPQGAPEGDHFPSYFVRDE